MFPSQTSLIPATVALTAFLERYGTKAWEMNYPYWYLGSTPYKYLIGPIIPFFGSLIHKLLPTVSLFDILICLVIFTSVLSALGWSILAGRISGKKALATAVGITILVMPWKYFSGLVFDETSSSIARSLLPFCLVLVWNYLQVRSKRNLIIVAIAVGVLFLINTGVFLSLIIGVVALAVSKSFKEGKIKFLDRNLKRIVAPLIIGLTLSLLWYGAGYWWVQLVNPGIGGVAGVKVILKIFDFLKNIVPLVLVVVILYLNSKIKDKLTVFSLTWILTFTILTLYRFIANPTFWMDWSFWLTEIEIGLAFLFIIGFKRLYGVVIIPFLVVFWVYSLIGKPALISKEMPQAMRIMENVAQTVDTDRVFLSGSTVFWANALSDIYQVRGGRDQVSVNPDWDKAAWVFREEKDEIAINKWLRKLNVVYVLVHTNDSREYFHDYKNVSGWKRICKEIWEKNGDILLRCESD